MVAKVEEPNVEVLNIKNAMDDDTDTDGEEDEEVASGSEDEGEEAAADIEMADEAEPVEENSRTTNPNLLSHFWKLANLDEVVRCEAVVALMSELKKTGNEDEIKYTVQRLVKGLSSSRKAARQGFSTALTHVMNLFNVESEHVLSLMSKHLAVQGSFKGQEESEAYFGQVFGVIALCRSKLNSGGDTNMELVKKLIENLLVLMKKKSYLAEICAHVICENILPSVKNSDYGSIEPTLKSIIEQGWKKCSPEELLITITVQSRFQETLSAKYFKGNWGRSQILHESNFKDLSRVLMDTTNTAHPRVHVLWDHVLNYLFSQVEQTPGLFDKFWNVIVLQGLMQSTHERKFLAMNVILKMASRLSVEQVKVVFGECIVRCMINSCQSKMNYLFNAVRNVLQKLPDQLAENKDAEQVIITVLKCLTGKYGHVAFDSMTKSKTIEELTSKLSNDMKGYFDWLKQVFTAGTTSTEDKEATEIPEKDVNECRGWVAEQMIVLLRACKSKKDETLLIEITNFLFFHAHFSALKKTKKEPVLKSIPSIPISDATHQLYKTRFNTALAELSNIYQTKVEGETKNPIGGVGEDGELYTWKVLCFAKKILEMPKHAQLVAVWTPEVYESWNTSLEKISAMQAEGDTDGIFSIGTQLLFVHTTLQLFSNREEAIDTLQELDVCFEKSKEKKRRKKTEPHWTEVLTEILLGFMAQSSHLMRQVVDLVYPTLIPHLTEDAVDLLIKAIKPGKKAAEEGEQGMEFENLSDVEEIDESEKMEGEGKEVTEEEPNVEDEEESDSESDDSDDDEGSDFEIDENFKAELKAALGDAAVGEDEEDDEEEKDGEDEDDEDVDMDTCKPEQLKAMDQALAAVFKARNQKQNEKKKKKDVKLSLMHFKLRVLDLIEIFIKKQPKDSKILLFLEPLYDVINASNLQSNDQPLFERTLGIVKNKLCTLHEYPSGKDLDIEAVHAQIERLIEMARTSSTALLVEYISQGIVYLIRVLRGSPELKEPSPRRTRSKRATPQKEAKKEVKAVDPSHVGCLNEERLVGCYKTALLEFMTKKSSHLQPVLFNKLIQRFPYLGWRLASELPQYMNSGCNNFRKVKAVEMLKLLFSHKDCEFEKHLKGIHKSISDNIVTSLKATKEEGYSFKARQFQQIVNIADTLVREASAFPEISNELDREGLKDSLTEALDSAVISRSTSVQSYCKKVLSALNNTETVVPKKKKRKNSK